MSAAEVDLPDPCGSSMPHLMGTGAVGLETGFWSRGRTSGTRPGSKAASLKASLLGVLETGAVVAVTVDGGAAGDTQTIPETLPQAGEHIAEVACATNRPEVGERVQQVKGSLG